MDNFKPMQFNEIGSILNLDASIVTGIAWRALSKL
jgi:hypothetical protein